MKKNRPQTSIDTISSQNFTFSKSISHLSLLTIHTNQINHPMKLKHHLYFVLFFAFLHLNFSPAAPTIKGYKLYNLSGYHVYVEMTAINTDAHTTSLALELLQEKLTEVDNFLLTAKAKRYLKRVRFFMDWNNGSNKGAQYHVSRQWVVAHGLPPEMAKSVHITSIHNFINWTQNQPYMVLHEMAHAYHDLRLSYNNIYVKEAYQNAISKGLYSNISYKAGNSSVKTPKRAYALNSAQEYFAEITKAFFGRNDYYPFNRADLKTYDPEGYKLMRFMWQQNKNPKDLIPKVKKVYNRLKSFNSNIDSRVIIINQRSEPVDGYWIDYQGEEKYYFTIDPGQSLSQSSYVSHVWRVKNKAKQTLKTFTCNHPKQTIKIK